MVDVSDPRRMLTNQIELTNALLPKQCSFDQTILIGWMDG